MANLTPVLLILVANLSPAQLNRWQVLLIPMHHHDLQISSQIFKKIELSGKFVTGAVEPVAGVVDTDAPP